MSIEAKSNSMRSSIKDLKCFASFCRKIIGVGRNYRNHALELNNEIPKEPLLFLKPTSSLLLEGKGPIKIPKGCQHLHHEVELAVIIGKAGHMIPESYALDHIGGYALALDMTARDFQTVAKTKGLPWTLAKGWDTFCPISSLISRETIENPQNVDLWLKVDGQMKQEGNTKDMIFNIPNLISYISSIMSLEEGDVILTGTPEGVGPVGTGQKIECGLNKDLKMSFDVEGTIC